MWTTTFDDDSNVYNDIRCRQPCVQRHHMSTTMCTTTSDVDNHVYNDIRCRQPCVQRHQMSTTMWTTTSDDDNLVDHDDDDDSFCNLGQTINYENNNARDKILK